MFDAWVFIAWALWRASIYRSKVDEDSFLTRSQSITSWRLTELFLFASDKTSGMDKTNTETSVSGILGCSHIMIQHSTLVCSYIIIQHGTCGLRGEIIHLLESNAHISARHMWTYRWKYLLEPIAHTLAQHMGTYRGEIIHLLQTSRHHFRTI